MKRYVFRADLKVSIGVAFLMCSGSELSLLLETRSFKQTSFSYKRLDVALDYNPTKQVTRHFKTKRVWSVRKRVGV